ncbi:MAG: putative glycoside hydrolase [Chloroflexi bacterium]|nr:putative glycoside hydrolase [Chloroflexota bacterium]
MNYNDHVLKLLRCCGLLAAAGAAAVLAAGCHPAAGTDGAGSAAPVGAAAHPAGSNGPHAGSGATTGAATGAATGAMVANRSAQPANGTAAASTLKAATGSTPIFQAMGLYCTGWSAGIPHKLDSLIQTLHATGLNSLVIDVKDSDGAVSYYTPGVPLAVSIGACSPKPRENRTPDIDAVLKKLKAAHVHVVGRIVCFSDPILAAKHHEWAIMSKAGGLWRGKKGYWVDPTVQQVQQYDIDLAIDAVKRGFDEVQWDYVRFPSDGNTRMCAYHEPISKNGGRSLVIAKYLAKAYRELEPYHVPVTADIFGLTGTSKSDMGIGQMINPIADNVDAISPMVYPSHFAHGEYHMPNPNSQPYRTVLLSLRDAKRRIAGSHAIVRPWLQAFSLFGVHYGPAQIQDQLRAIHDDGISQFFFWNANNKYDVVQAALSSADGRKLLQQIASTPQVSTPARVAQK